MTVFGHEPPDNPDFCTIASAYGIAAYRIDKAADLASRRS